MKRSNLKRTSSLRSTGPPRRRTPIRPVNAKRRRREFARTYGSKERVEWIKQQRCACCESIAGCDNAHVGEGSGMGRKADASTIVPLCRLCHGELHNMGRERFESYNRIDLLTAARRVEARWQELNTNTN